MKIENTFEVEAPIQTVWTYLMDIQHVADCAPGAELTETVDEKTSKGKLNMKLGPISMSFAGTVVFTERDEAGHRVILKADGREQRGKGSASALVTANMEEAGSRTRVHIETDLTITGAAAQYGRGMIGDISQRMTGEFAKCLQEQIAQSMHPAAATSAEPMAEAGGPAPAAELPIAGAAPTVAAAPAAPTPRPTSARPPAKAQAVKGFRLFLWALWRALVRLVRRLFGGKRQA